MYVLLVLRGTTIKCYYVDSTRRLCKFPQFRGPVPRWAPPWGKNFIGLCFLGDHIIIIENPCEAKQKQMSSTTHTTKGAFDYIRPPHPR